MEYEITVVELPAKHLVGLSKRMSFADAAEECPALWEAFMIRRGEVPNVVEDYDYTYGVSANMEKNGDFDYWAALPVSSTTEIPSRMQSLTLRAGKYAKCVVDLKSIKDAYDFLYGEWAKSHPVDFQSACFERYARDWSEAGIELYVPLS